MAMNQTILVRHSSIDNEGYETLFHTLAISTPKWAVSVQSLPCELHDVGAELMCDKGSGGRNRHFSCVLETCSCVTGPSCA